MRISRSIGLDRTLIPLVVLVLVALLPSSARAQIRLAADSDWRVFVSPRIGFLQPGEAGPLDGWQPEGLRIVGGPVAGLAIELQSPLPWFSFRATVEQSVRNNLSFRDIGGDTGPDPFTDPLFMSRASALQSQVSLGAMARPFAGSPVRPIGVIGMGVRHWEWNPGELAASLVPRFPETRWDRSWHLGVGVEADAEPFAVRAEVLDYRVRAETGTGDRLGVTDRFVMLTLRWTGWR